MAEATVARIHQFRELWRYYQAGVINTAFGFGTYSLLVWLGVNLYIAQIIAQILGVTFNYFTYSRHVFKDRQAGKLRFALAYIVNYLVNLAFLALFDRFMRSPYLAGFLATVCASLVNYFALKHAVFVNGRDE